MTAADNNGKGKSWVGWLATLCVLLSAVIVLQIIILFRTSNIATRVSDSGRVSQDQDATPNRPSPVATQPLQPVQPVQSPRQTSSRTYRAPIHHRVHDAEIEDFFAEANALFTAMEVSFPDPFRHFSRIDPFVRFDSGWDSAMTVPTLDMRDMGDCYLILMNVPSTNLTDISVNLNGQVLTVNSSATDEDNGRSYSSFISSIQVPGPVADPKSITATFTNGLLRITIPKPASQPTQNKDARIL